MWTDDKDKFLYRMQSDIFIARVILYDSALYYRKRHMLLGWPSATMTGIVAILRSVDFAMIPPIYLTIITYILTILASISSTCTMLLDYGGKTQRCKEMSDNLYEILENIKLIRSFTFDKRPDADIYLLDISAKLVACQKKMELVPYSVFHQYYPDDLASLQFAFKLYDSPPMPISEIRIT
jgi:hypothetical protein